MGTPMYLLSLLQRHTTSVTISSLLCVIKPFQNGVYFKRKEFAPEGANSFLLKLIPIEKGGKTENGRVASLESVSTHIEQVL